MSRIDWYVEGTELGSCKCIYACPCPENPNVTNPSGYTNLEWLHALANAVEGL
jgi:hypothetical protein